MTAGRWTAGCVCGALRYSATGAPELQGLCHCRTCQRLTGSGHVGFICFAACFETIPA